MNSDEQRPQTMAGKAEFDLERKKRKKRGEMNMKKK